MDKVLWIGVVNVLPMIEGLLKGKNLGAYTNVIGLAKSQSKFHIMVMNKLEEIGFKLLSLEEVEKLEDRKKNYEITDEIRDMENGICNENIVQYGTFYTYKIGT